MDHVAVAGELREGIRCLREIRNAGPEARERVSQFLQSAPQLFRVKNDSVFTVGTDDLVVTLEPTERLFELAATVRAWKAERDLRQGL